MQTRVNFPDGTYAILREKVNVRGRKIMERTSIPALKALRRIRAARKAAEVQDGDLTSEQEMISYSEAEIEAMQRFEMAGVIAMLAHWTREDPRPRTIDELEELDPDVYETIATAVRPELWSLMGRPAVTPDDALDEQGRRLVDSPTGPSNGSANGSSPRVSPLEIVPVSPHPETSTESSSTGTENSSSEESTPASPTSST